MQTNTPSEMVARDAAGMQWTVSKENASFGFADNRPGTCRGHWKVKSTCLQRRAHLLGDRLLQRKSHCKRRIRPRDRHRDSLVHFKSHNTLLQIPLSLRMASRSLDPITVAPKMSNITARCNRYQAAAALHLAKAGKQCKSTPEQEVICSLRSKGMCTVRNRKRSKVVLWHQGPLAPY